MNSMEYNGIFAESVLDGCFPLRMCGVLHFGREDMYPLPEDYEKAYRTSDCIAFETEMDVIDGSDFMCRMRELSAFPAGESLSDLLTEATFSELVGIAEGLGFSEGFISSFRPWYCASLLTNTALQREGLSRELGIDAALHRRAKADGKEIVSLESPESQLDILQNIDGGDAERFICSLITELKTIRQFSENLFRLWRVGDSVGLSQLVKGNFSDSPEQRSVILAERNRRWADMLLEKSRECPVLAVVGAGHLIGDGSLPDALVATASRRRSGGVSGVPPSVGWR